MNKKASVLSLACLSAVLTAGAPVLWAKTTSLKSHGYTQKEQISAVTAINFAMTGMQALNENLSKAYGADAVFIRLPASKHSARESELKLAKTKGKKLMMQMAAYEPLMSLCAVDSGIYYLTGHVAQATAALLEKRGLASTVETQKWLREGGASGVRQLGAISKLNCVPVRAAFNGAVLKLEDSYILLHAAMEENPPPKAKKACSC